MITLITGAPGAGKTSALVSLLLELAKGRAVYTDGIPDLKIPHVELVDPHQWMAECEDGAAICIDEVQRIWRPAGPGAKVPADIEALETHRHRGIDFFLLTQHPNLLHQNVRRLVGRHVHLRDVGLLGRWWYEWPEATNPETFRNAPIKKRYTLDKKTFGLYKSASLHVKPIRSIPRSVVIFAVAAVVLAYLVFTAWQRISARINPASGKTAAAAPGAAASAPVAPASAARGVVHVPGGGAGVDPRRVVYTVPARLVMPVELAGCVVTAVECLCTTNEAPPRLVRDAGSACVRVALGGGVIGSHPDREALAVVPDDSAYGARAVAPGGPAAAVPAPPGRAASGPAA